MVKFAIYQLNNMKKAKIYKPTKTAMQSGKGKLKNWILKFETKDNKFISFMGWESGDDTMKEVILEFSTKEKAIEYAKNNDILYEIREPKKQNFIIKSYADNFLKD
tara:strand:+ start:211 stop:528 length:318 start_codon:yes stop_codon:yes gene_type:complete